MKPFGRSPERRETMEAAGMIRLTIESRLENVALIGGAVRGIADMLSLDKIIIYHLELCVVEAVNNAIKHAYHSEAGHSVEVEFLRCRDRLTFRVCDNGESMIPEKVRPFSFDPAKLETLPERGMGVFIVNTFMDEVRYETVNRRNILTMVKHLKKNNARP
jgi:serine/threonine-protein kinase RsbW